MKSSIESNRNEWKFFILENGNLDARYISKQIYELLLDHFDESSSDSECHSDRKPVTNLIDYITAQTTSANSELDPNLFDYIEREDDT